MNASSNNSQPTPTLRTIAEALEMSVSGVSIALRNDPSIPKSTCERVQAEAARQGYRRNPLVSAFCAHRKPSNTSGLTTLAYIWHDGKEHSKGAHALFHEGACEAARQLNYRINTFDPVTEGLDHLRLDGILQARGIRGVIVAPPHPVDMNIPLQWTQYAVVSIGFNLANPITHNVSLDNFETVRGVFQELRRLGFRRPGLVLDREFDQRIQHHWSSAFLAYTHQFENPGNACLFHVDSKSLDVDAIARWVKKSKVDVVLGHRAGLMGQLQKCGLNIPEEIGFVTMQGNHVESGIASIQRHSRQIGKIAVEMLIDELHRNQRGLPIFPKRFRVLGTLLPAASLGKAAISS